VKLAERGSRGSEIDALKKQVAELSKRQLAMTKVYSKEELMGKLTAHIKKLDNDSEVNVLNYLQVEHGMIVFAAIILIYADSILCMNTLRI
jgi:hypothetical protein